MTASQAQIGYGSRFQIYHDGAWVDLGEVNNLTLPSAIVDQVDVTSMRSIGRTRTYIDGLINAGSCSFDMNYVPGSEGDLILVEILALPFGQPRTQQLRVVFAEDNEVRTFSGNLQSYDLKAPTGDKLSATVNWKVTTLATRGSLTFEEGEFFGDYYGDEYFGSYHGAMV